MESNCTGDKGILLWRCSLTPSDVIKLLDLGRHLAGVTLSSAVLLTSRPEYFFIGRDAMGRDRSFLHRNCRDPNLLIDITTGIASLQHLV